MIIVLVLVMCVVLWVSLRRRRQGTLAGRNSAKPTYTVEPPQRRQERASRGVL